MCGIFGYCSFLKEKVSESMYKVYETTMGSVTSLHVLCNRLVRDGQGSTPERYCTSTDFRGLLAN